MKPWTSLHANFHAPCQHQHVELLKESSTSVCPFTLQTATATISETLIPPHRGNRREIHDLSPGTQTTEPRITAIFGGKGDRPGWHDERNHGRAIPPSWLQRLDELLDLPYLDVLVDLSPVLWHRARRSNCTHNHASSLSTGTPQSSEFSAAAHNPPQLQQRVRKVSSQQERESSETSREAKLQLRYCTPKDEMSIDTVDLGDEV